MLSLALALLLAAAPADFDQYLDQIRGRVQSMWKYPAKSESLQATVKFNIDRAGRITDLEIAKPSGRKDFDASVLEAVRSATPFPPLLSILKKSELREVGMTFKGKSVVVDAPKPATPKKSDGKSSIDRKERIVRIDSGWHLLCDLGVLCG